MPKLSGESFISSSTATHFDCSKSERVVSTSSDMSKKNKRNIQTARPPSPSTPTAIMIRSDK